jgi:hypothetical protein
MASLKEIRFRLRAAMETEVKVFAASDHASVLAAFDRAWADTVTDIADGTEPEKPKRTYVRKPKAQAAATS